MINTAFRRLAALGCPFVLFAVFGALSLVSAQSCENVADAQIVAEVYSRIKADKALAPQVNHINVVAVNAAVKLQGWTDTKKDFDKVVAIVSEVRCVRVVNVNAFEPQPPPPGDLTRGGSGCASGTKPCGDICIPEADVCGIMAESGNEE